MKKGTRTTLIVIGGIALVFIFFAFFTETEIRIEVNSNSKSATPEYPTFELCMLGEIQKCSPVDCRDVAEEYCADVFSCYGRWCYEALQKKDEEEKDDD